MVRLDQKFHDHPKIQVEDDRSRQSCLSMAAAPPLRAGLPADIQSTVSTTEFAFALNTTENP
ncbi:hypothetical protein CJ178_12675 [Rhodococcus sp. ACPA4]|nr:hypothetical protein CJ178_12675 [Rhodococcus sp. ACPA4]ROZ49625.1 hypothetical protein EEB13_06910 [Rhodococcus sp. WS3]